MRARLTALGAPRRPVAIEQVEPMLAGTGKGAFDREGWIFELKYDGFRLIAERRDGRARLRYRGGEDATETFPEIARALTRVAADLVLDGEVVVLDDQGRPSFERLQQRVSLRRPVELARGAITHPAILFAFDLLGFEDRDLRGLPLGERKGLLASLLPPRGPLRYADHVETQGVALFQEVARRGLEGLVAKRASAPYRAGRSPDWLKLPVHRVGDFVIVGFTAGLRGEAELGALLLACHDGERLRYAGRVGSGIDVALRAELLARLQGARRPSPPCKGAPAGPGHLWTAPELVCQVRYKERTRQGLLRQPCFVRLRLDQRPTQCPCQPIDRSDGLRVPPLPEGLASRAIAFTHPDKVFWQPEGYTKGDLIAYYRAVAASLLPYLRDRPVVLTRYPDGIEGKSFFQKDAPDFTPSWIRTARIRSAHARREIDYFVLDDLDALLYVVNLGTIPLHLWSSRVGSLQRPDWCILDLDPKGAPFPQVVALARAAHALCEQLGLPCFVKTSGQAGLHLLIPLGGQCSHAQSRALARLLATVLERQHPQLATTVRMPAERGGRVYLDFLQNGYGKTLAAPFSVRALPGAPVSMPLAWPQVKARLDPRRFTIASVPRLLHRHGEDPLAPLLRLRPNLLTALDQLGDRISRTRP